MKRLPDTSRDHAPASVECNAFTPIPANAKAMISVLPGVSDFSYGAMFWLPLQKFVGSYFFLIAVSRWKFAS